MQNQNALSQNSLGVIELSHQELESVAGAEGFGVEWGTSTAVSAAFVVGAATVSAPVIAGVFVGASLLASGAAIYYALQSD